MVEEKQCKVIKIFKECNFLLDQTAKAQQPRMIEEKQQKVIKIFTECSFLSDQTAKAHQPKNDRWKRI